MLLDQVGEAVQPAWFQPQDIIGKPDMIRRIGLLQPGQLGDHIFRAANVVALAPDRLGAPVAVVGAAARGHHVHRVEAVAILPELAVACGIDQIPGGKWQRVELLDIWPSPGVHERAALIAKYQPLYLPQPVVRW